MYRRILVPLDGSALAERALPYAEALAKRTGATLRLVQAVLAPVVPSNNWARAQQRAVMQAEEYLRRTSAALAERGTAAETAVVYGDAAGVILDTVEAWPADLVVMATHGRSGLGRWLYGSVAKAVLVRSPVPVLLVRAWQAGQLAEAPGERPRVLVPLDGSTFAESALPAARELAEALDGTLVLLQAIRQPEHALTADGRMVASVDQQLAAAREASLADLLDVARRLGLEPGRVTLEVRVGAPASAIVAASRAHQAALVVMATHGRTGLVRLVTGSVAGEVLRRGTVPLLLVRPPLARARHEQAA